MRNDGHVINFVNIRRIPELERGKHDSTGRVDGRSWGNVGVVPGADGTFGVIKIEIELSLGYIKIKILKTNFMGVS